MNAGVIVDRAGYSFTGLTYQFTAIHNHFAVNVIVKWLKNRSVVTKNERTLEVEESMEKNCCWN
jgi:hypothetical protein